MFALFLSMLLSAPQPASAADISWIEVKSGGANSGFHVTGHVIPQDGALHIESAQVQGRVTSILKREGERVAAGTPLLTINSAECLSLREEEKVAQTRGLQDLLEATRKREAQLGLSIQGDQCELLSHDAGTITKRGVENGSAFNVGDPLVTILETGNLSVELELPEQAIPQVRIGQKVSLELALAPGYAVRSFIQAIVPSVDPTNRTVKVRVRPVRLPRGATLDSLVFGQIDTGTQEPILVVPTTAVVFDENSNWVVKHESPNPRKIQVQVVSEDESTSAIRPTHAGELVAGDHVAGSGAIFFFKR